MGQESGCHLARSSGSRLHKATIKAASRGGYQKGSGPCRLLGKEPQVPAGCFPGAASVPHHIRGSELVFETLTVCCNTGKKLKTTQMSISWYRPIPLCRFTEWNIIQHWKWMQPSNTYPQDNLPRHKIVQKRHPGWCGSVDWVPACEQKGPWFDSRSGPMPGL